MAQSLEIARIIVIGAALTAALLSFGIYFAISINWLKPGGKDKAEAAADQAVEQVRGLTAPSAAEAAELVKALASLGDTLVKAGPALWSLIGAALFLLIAALSAGVFEQGAGSTVAGGDLTNNTSLPANENLRVH